MQSNLFSAVSCTATVAGVTFKPHALAQVAQVIEELAAAGEAELCVKLDSGLVDRLCAYADSVAHFPTALKEQEWRNGWFSGISRRAMDSELPDPCPTHTAWLVEAGTI
jgi:hypothetical protein